VAGLAAGQSAPGGGDWPRVASFPTMAQLEAAYGASLLPHVLWLDTASGPGYLREWRPSGLPPERHIGYAVQWWSFALLLLGLFVGLNLKKRND
jgi:cytochrome oxidase assembly protein ShyY1